MSEVFSLLLISQVTGAAFDLTLEQCRELVLEHKATSSIEYKAGVDVNNQPVTPADLDSNKTYGLGDQVVIDLQLPLKKHAPNYPPPAPPPPGSGGLLPNDYINDASNKSKLHVGSVVVQKDGKTWINGQSVDNETLEQLAEACRLKYPDL